MSKTTTIVHLRVIKGGKITYNKDGSIANENQIVKLQHGKLEWVNYMKNLHRNGFCEAHAEKVLELDGKKDEKGAYITKNIDIKKIEAEVQAIMKPVSDKKINLADELAELKKEMLELQKGDVKIEDIKEASKAINKTPTDNTPDVNEELEIARKKVHEVTGKKPHHMTQLKKLNEIIEDNK